MVDIPTTTEVNHLLTEWRAWLATRTDALLSLEERVRSAGTDADVADVAAAFVARKAITDRLAEVTTLAARDRAGAAALTAVPLYDDLGGLVGANLTDAATLLDAVVQHVEQRVASREQLQVQQARTSQQADADLAVAQRLAAELGMQINHVAELQQRLTRRTELTNVAAEAATVRASLEAAARERGQVLQQWALVAGRMVALGATEARVRELAARCRAKVLQAPLLAVPSVATLAVVVDEVGEIGHLPWVAARGRLVPVLTKLDRLAAALAEAERRFEQPLRRRDELRGLLQAFADKASCGGVVEAVELDALYQQAKAVLWVAPSDLVRAEALVEQYVHAVNAKLKGVAR